MRKTTSLLLTATFLLGACDQLIGGVKPAEQEAASASSVPPAAAPAPIATKPEVLGSNEFETWFVNGGVKVSDGAIEAPDGTKTADAIAFGADSGMNRPYPQNAIASGQTVKASVYLWGEPGKRVVFYITRSCGASTPEGGSTTVTLTDVPTKYELEHTFQEAHACAMLELKGADGAHTVNAWKSHVTFS